MNENTRIKRKPRIKGTLLPNEHGSWGFLFEPLAAAFAIAPGVASAGAAVMYIGIFLLRQPLRVFIADKMAARNLPRTRLTIRFVFLFAFVALAGGAVSVAFAGFYPLIPLVFAVPFALFQASRDFARKSRELGAELAAAVAISSSGAVVAIAGGLSGPEGLVIWGLIAARLVPSVLYIRSRIRLEKGKPNSPFGPVLSHIAAVAFVCLLFFSGSASALTVIVFVFLLLRAVVGLSGYRKKVRIMVIGVWEVIYGSVTVISIVLGYYLGV